MPIFDFFKSLSSAHVDYLLVGGLAVNLHGIPRMTVDIDIVLVMEENNIQRFLEMMEKNGFNPTLPIPASVLKDSATLLTWRKERNLIAFSFQKNEGDFPLTVDVLLTDKINVGEAMKKSIIRKVDDVDIRVASIADLIALKSNTQRLQDLFDIEQLQRIAI